MLSRSGLSRSGAAAGAALGAAGFVYWDATDKFGGVGVTRAATATAAAALIVTDYKLSLRGLTKDSAQFVAARHEVTSAPPRAFCICASATAACTPKRGSSYPRPAGCRRRSSDSWRSCRTQRAR